MLRPQFIVVYLDNEWKIRHDGRHYGPYTTERGAILAAIEAAQRAGGHGHEPRVLVEGPTTKKLYVEWTCGTLCRRIWRPSKRTPVASNRSPKGGLGARAKPPDIGRGAGTRAPVFLHSSIHSREHRIR